MPETDNTTVTITADGRTSGPMEFDEFTENVVENVAQMTFEAELNVLGKTQLTGLTKLKRGQWVKGTFEAQVVKTYFEPHPKLGRVRVNHLVAVTAVVTETL